MKSRCGCKGYVIEARSHELRDGGLPGRTMARIGLRMMPPFPWSPLSFRTAGFPQSGWKAGISGSAFPSPRVMALYGLHPPFVHPAACSATSSFKVEERGALVHHRSSGHCRFAPGALAPVRVIVSRSIITYAAPCAPLAGTFRLHRHGLYEMPSLCAMPLTPRRPASGSVLSLAILYRHVIV
jgi:hypothetical protein